MSILEQFCQRVYEESVAVIDHIEQNEPPHVLKAEMKQLILSLVYVKLDNQIEAFPHRNEYQVSSPHLKYVDQETIRDFLINEGMNWEWYVKDDALFISRPVPFSYTKWLSVFTNLIGNASG